MRFSLDSGDGANLIRAYGEGSITVNEQKIETSVVITANAIQAWPPQCFDDLAEPHFAALVEFQPEIVLIGTGASQQFLHPRLTQVLFAQNIGVETMNTAAACRTYNIIMGEGRRVVAALLMI